jgi:hypothetical protein
VAFDALMAPSRKERELLIMLLLEALTLLELAILTMCEENQEAEDAIVENQNAL